MKALRLVLAAAFVLITSVFMSGCISIPSGDRVKAEMLRFGLYENSTDNVKIAAPDSAAGYQSEGDAYFIRSGSRLSVKKGQGFGFSYRIYNLPGSGVFELETIITHPEIVNPSGKTFTGSTFILTEPYENGRFEDYAVYMFSSKFEMVAGSWVFEIGHQGKTLLKKSFEITPVH